MFIFLTYIFTSYPGNIHEKKFCTHEISTRKNAGPTKYPRKKILFPRTRKTFGPTKYPREKISDPRNTLEKKISNPRNTHEKKFQTHETHRRKNFGPTKYPREKKIRILKGTVAQLHETYETHDDTIPPEFSTLVSI